MIKELLSIFDRFHQNTGNQTLAFRCFFVIISYIVQYKSSNQEKLVTTFIKPPFFLYVNSLEKSYHVYISSLDR